MSIAALCRFFRDRKGNIAITFAFALIPALYLTGMSIDYISATQKKAKLDALADAAVLAALTPSMLHQSDTNAQAAAQNVFQAQLPSIPGLNIDPQSGLTVTIQSTITTRNITVTYNASSQNYFPGVLKLNAINLAGTSKGSASFPPNINFYLLLDNSPSMAIPATQAGINTMVTKTGCAFACHDTTNPNDGYSIAKANGISTRIQLVGNAVTSLASTASTTAAQNQSTYQMALYIFSNHSNNATALHMQVKALTANLSSIASLPSGTIDVMPVAGNNNDTNGNYNDDTATDFDSAMSAMNGLMPNPGTGLAGATPQEILFIVTDGVNDAVSSNLLNSCSQPLQTGSGGLKRCQEPMDVTWCTTIKNRGIRIALLYTVYLPMTTDSWYNSWVAPFQKWNNPTGNDGIANNIQNCATPGLYASVSTDGDITAALNKLFQDAVQMAHLTQ